MASLESKTRVAVIAKPLASDKQSKRLLKLTKKGSSPPAALTMARSDLSV